MMRILFVNPNLRPDSPYRFLPLGLAYVITACEEAGIDFETLDISINDFSDSCVENYISTHEFDVVAVGAIATHYRWVKWFVNMVKEKQPRCTVILGNSVGSSISEVVFQHTSVDIVVLGEGDVTTVEVLKALANGEPLGEVLEPLEPVPHTNCDLPPSYRGKGIAGIVFRDANGTQVHTGQRTWVRNIDDFPFPNWDLFNVESYIQRCPPAHGTTRFPSEEVRNLPVTTARGCVYKCTFCHHAYWNYPYRHRSPASVVAEIKRNIQKYGTNFVTFWDELTFFKLNQAETFVDALLAENLNIHWVAAVRCDLFGRDDLPYEDRIRVAEKFRQSGCISLNYSLESGSDEILEAMNKRFKAANFIEQVLLLRKVGIVSNASLVIGYPQETKETLAVSMEMCREARVYPSPGFILPLPETEMWKYCVNNGYIDDPDSFLTSIVERQDFSVNLTRMSDEELVGEVNAGLAKLNEAFGGHLDANSLIKTGGYARHQKHQESEVRRVVNATESLNYSAKVMR
jgi:anaerobic magnesium-protoporphyrin IX monomethyl ester cyclase